VTTIIWKIEFAIDTFRIEAYIDKYIEADHSNAGMVAATNEATHKYDSLLDKYYNKLLLVLTPEDKKVLTEAQNAWLAFRDSELKLIQTLGNDKYSGGGTIQELINRASYMDLIKDRTVSIFYHLSMVTGEY
jgi:uncharacterized protein YecT (DUF1311 family)